MSTVAPRGTAPLHTVQVLGGRSAGSGAQVRALVGGLVARGVSVTVCAPREAELLHRFGDLGARHVPVPRRGDPAALAALRQACATADLVHAHGLHAAARARLALGARTVPMVVTWHAGAPSSGARARLQQLMERRVARAASVVLATSPELVDRARARGARDARLGSLAAFPGAEPADPHVPEPAEPSLARQRTEAEQRTDAEKTRAELGAVGRPLLLTVAALQAGRGHDTLLDAAGLWRPLAPQPLLLVAGEGPLWAALQRRIAREDLPVRLLGRRTDVRELLAAADVVLVPHSREVPSVLAREALLAQVPLVVAASPGMSELVGAAAELVPPDDPGALAAAVTALLCEPRRRAALRLTARTQTRSWPTEDDMVAQVLSVYDELTGQAEPPRPARR
ncbi:glycosyltransferase family 4 protein [Streptomyces sp. NA04227]|uniref:glycosyltransferase family 4 protein n=1 Tax=Streptomyces sp. NA04227 TaxID=2742136 RepID=UPI0015909CB3|nr:glycosyltransferase family 4 protein [Streptomyces sp. NA04227]QKW05734.1 glycosyltransferase family 4 protein [Streptomyces sp. NA04227]